MGTDRLSPNNSEVSSTKKKKYFVAKIIHLN